MYVCPKQIPTHILWKCNPFPESPVLSSLHCSLIVMQMCSKCNIQNKNAPKFAFASALTQLTYLLRRRQQGFFWVYAVCPNAYVHKSGQQQDTDNNEPNVKQCEFCFSFRLGICFIGCTCWLATLATRMVSGTLTMSRIANVRKLHPC